MNDNSIPGARESNAGDEFHILWAARQAFKLLNLQSGLKTVLVEKVAPADDDASESDVFLGVDLSEYYDGSDFNAASKVVASQLKFSTRHPQREWTASRLCAKKSANAIPIVKKLADIYNGFAGKFGRENTIEKLRVRLVSNQPISAALASALDTAKQILDSIDKTVETPANALLKQLAGTDNEEIEKLYNASKLGSAAFTDFLRALDFTKLGEESNAFQRLRLVQEISVSINYDPQATLRSLCDLIRYEARPEAEKSFGLTEHDVLAAIGIRNRDALFPAPSRLQTPENPIETKESENVARALLASKTKRVLAHGNAGVGKTTTVLGLSKHLPEGSQVVIYDCYGGGDYLIAGDERHTSKRAFLQLTNELAATCGTPLLIKPLSDVADTIREFRRALAAAAEAIAATHEAVLVVVIDAADNAVVAAKGSNDCFVFPLWNFPLPESCRLLVTSRSHRRANLNPPADIEEYELQGFDENASAEHLRRYFPAATDDECGRFHLETAGNPRLQYYNLEKAKAASTVSVGDFLRDAYRTPDQIFADLVEAAVSHSPEPEKARNFLSLMVTLKPPVPLAIFAVVCEIKPAEAKNFCRALMPGVVLEENEFVFRDEDFETYLRSQVSDEQVQSAHTRLAEKFLSLAAADDYAAREVAGHLFYSGKYSKLINLALAGPEPLAIKDEVMRLRVKRERINFALGAAQNEARTDDIIKLLVIAAETARSNEAVATLIRENPDLAAAYADPEEVGRFYLAEENLPWLGAAHLRTAALFARKPELKAEALEHLRAADAWFRRKRALPDYESDHWETTELDIAAGAEAIFWTIGAEAAKDWLARWRPLSAVWKSLEILVASLVKQNCAAPLEDFLRTQKIPIVARAVVLSAMYAGSTKISRDITEKAFQDLSRFVRTKNYHKHVGEWGINVCELFAAHDFDKASIIELIDALCPPLPERTPDGYGDLLRYDAPVRAQCLKAVLSGEDLAFEEILPEELRPTEQKPPPMPQHYDSDSNSDRRKWREYVGKLMPIYKLRARTIIEKTCKIEDISAELRQSLSEQNTRSGDWHGSLNSRFTVWTSVACDALLNCAGDAEPLIGEIVTEAEKIVGKYAAWRWSEIAEKLVVRRAYLALAINVLERAAANILENAFPSRERWEFLVACANSARFLDESLSRSFYRKAIEVAEGINDENAHLLKMLGDFAAYTARSGDGAKKIDFSFRLARAVELHEDYVSESSILPRQKTIEAASLLNAASGLALCARWDRENRYQINDVIVPLARVLTNNGDVPAVVGLHLLRLGGKWFDPSEEAIRSLDLLNAGGANRRQIENVLGICGLWIRRDVPLRMRKRAARTIVEWVRANKFADSPGIAELEQMLEFLETFSTEKVLPASVTRRPARAEEKPEETTKESIVAKAEKGLTDDFEQQVAEILRAKGGYHFLQDYFMAVENRLLPAQRTAYLEKLLSLDFAAYYTDDFLRVWRRCFERWREFEPVKEWAKNGIPRFFEKNFLKLAAYEYSAEKNLNEFLNLPLVAAQSRSDVLLPAVVRHFDSFVPSNFYAVAALLVQTLDVEKAVQILDWALARLESFLAKERGKPLPALTSGNLPETSDRALAHFFWSLFGHPDKRVRWQAVHAAREIIKQQNDVLLDELCRLSFTENAGAFGTPQMPFYWMSARAWFLLLAGRLAAEKPDLLKPYADVFAAHTLDSNFPHAQIRELAKRAALNLAEHYPNAYSATELEAITFANSPRSCAYPVKAREYEYTHRYYESKRKRRFQIGSMDTLPYWYAPAAQLFDLKAPAFAEMAADLIENVWGFTDDDCLKDPLRDESRYDWRLKGNDHGSNPVVEDLRLYLEYHAMFCVAGELIDSVPLVCPDDEKYESSCPSAEWLADNVAISPKFWSADLRLPTPLAPEFWGEAKTIEEWFAPAATEFHLAANLSETGEPLDEIIVKGYSDVWDSEKWSESIVSSALVAPETARSLLFALQMTENPHDYFLPSHPGREEIEKDEFQLTAWLNQESLNMGLNKQDESARENNGDFYVLGDDFIEEMNVSTSVDFTRYFQADNSQIARLEIWNDMLETERIEESTSRGKRLWINREKLLEYLNNCGRDLILEVTIKRNLKNRHPAREREEKKRETYAKSRIYLFRRDGTIETLDGNGGSGQEDS